MRLVCVILLCSVMLFIGLSQADATTLQPGTYKLEWVVSEPRDDSPPLEFIFLSSISEEDAAKFKGLQSSNCMFGGEEKFALILDESQGTGKGYDTAYLFIPEGEIADLSQAVKIPLTIDESDGQLFSKESIKINLPQGEEGAQVTRETQISLRVYVDSYDLEEESDDEMAMESFGVASIFSSGCWQGKIKTDTSEISVQLFDANGNGVYGDKMTMQQMDDGESYPDMGDMLMIGDYQDKGSTEALSGMLYLAEAVPFDGELYVFDTSKTGDSLQVSNYTGPAGTIRIKAVDGFGKSMNCPMALAIGDMGYINLDVKKDAKLPVGDYEFYCIMSQSNDLFDEDSLSVEVKKNSPVKIKDGKTTTVNIGGPITASINPDSDVITVKRGDDLDVSLVFNIGQDSIQGISNKKAAVNIRDANGKLLISGKAAFG